ncbi:late competence protein ComER [Ammoniphilus oxalaticus]|uniref:Pyrroline-5-carboxylate reductase n=1 Tax=Ammoniphilus oxalaticus TaxID=66863 RepID=A0A419SL60_9BACL|nr:late competence protein ComER [Ammoniphilus oxalaticus]RKD24666.1 late competence protein ComER [Ammoniphilus oxalaticus]
MKVGFIGTGSMGSILVDAFLTAKTLTPDQIIVSNRTREKALLLSDRFPGLTVAETNIQTVQMSEIIFLCVKPLEFKRVIDDVSPHLGSNKIVISITSPILIEDLEKQMPCKIAKVIPSITNSVAAGASLLMFGNRCGKADRIKVRNLFEQISRPLEIEESKVRVSSDIVSCGPAFISYLLQRFIHAAVEETGISNEEATFLTTEMVIGLAALLSRGPFDLPTLQQRVCVPGGVTGAGILALEQIGDVFNHMYKNTQKRYDEDLKDVSDMFYGTNH